MNKNRRVEAWVARWNVSPRVAGLLLSGALSFLALEVQASEGSSARPPHFHLPLVDLPFNAQTKWSYPSMAQSTALTQSFYDLAHWGFEDGLGWDPHAGGWGGFWARTGFFLMDAAVLMLLPPGEAWQHEEWHRAVMAHRGIASFNDVYNLDLSASVINVSHESDADLIRLKKLHNEDQVRMAEAGMEGELALLTQMQREAFFHKNMTYHSGLYWIINISVTQYMETCSSDEADDTTDESHEKESADISKRDFIGLDCNGWIRDLNRPDEPYEARGVHPSGVGINRYTKYSDLSRVEKNYLRLNKNMSYLNLIDPFLLGRSAFEGRGLFGEASSEYNGSIKHNLTSFGSDTSINALYRSEDVRFFSAIHAYHNYSRWFPGVELGLVDIDLNSSWLMGIDLHLWQQPKDFAFRTTESMTGGRLGVQVTYIRPGTIYQPFFKLSAKSKGWVSGEVNQDSTLQSLAGLTLDLTR